jgi:membrane protein DedA with SNARE-associated domain
MSGLNFAARYVIAAVGASLIPAAALACPGCMVGDPKTAATYFGMTVIMSALPILLVCGLGYWLWRRHS